MVMPQSAGAPTGGAGGARSRVKAAEAQPIRPSQTDGKASNNYGINGANGEQQVSVRRTEDTDSEMLQCHRQPKE